MTPFAHLLTKQLTFPLKDRIFGYDDLWSFVRNEMSDIHCFEVTDITSKCILDHPSILVRENMFLPARNGTWLESVATGMRSALYAKYIDKDVIRFRKLVMDSSIPVVAGAPVVAIMPYQTVRFSDEEFIYSGNEVPVQLLLLTINIINQPQFINRKQFMPHRGLEKSLLRTFGVGKFPLRAFTEITLKVGTTVDMIEKAAQEAHFTGRKCYHWVRSFRRTVRGKEQVVKDHWRGDPALGIKQSRYKVVT